MQIFPQPLEQTIFTNSFVEELLGDPSQENVPRQVPGYHYSPVQPTPVPDPHLLAWSDELAAFLGLVRPPERGPAVELLAGNRVATTMQPYAARYGGHQFGNWAGQLGDGRAISLGELGAVDGSRWELQLKGAGPTPYSRRADGRAVLRSSIREFLCSEAMHHLGVPTTRALSLVGTGDEVVRDMFYNGNARPEPGAIVCRVAPSFVRFGNFQILLAHQELDNLRQLADYVIRHHFPELGVPSPAVYAQWFAEVCRRTAIMVAHWMTVGFVHGVMNTDNMSILGLTIDYGPYGWLEPYEPGWTPNTTDFSTYRYAFGQQPRVALWNLMQLAQALTPLVSEPNADLRPALDTYVTTFNQARQAMLLRKLGLTPQPDGQPDYALTEALHAALETAEADMTLFFRRLSHLVPVLLTEATGSGPAVQQLIEEVSYNPAGAVHGPLQEWLEQYAQRLGQESAAPEAIRAGMLAANPKYVLRNYLAQLAIEAAEAGDLTDLERLYHVLKTPFDEHPAYEDLAAKRPDWARTKPGSATLSCSS
ncbi:protein adenylyltransferase SelO [Hymenobacter metallilatus]|uniref:Protein nucleotidyltransferase YdiU n=1 Tax=Hymenobacter metallilatus TaxID=2493666 RepID=A0A428JCD6_9BACT|nr:YdiU family protein [Hymenobacter metallilatus]RSK29793.1 YdiU family protein [Hymenobacter metallilatus]